MSNANLTPTGPSPQAAEASILDDARNLGNNEENQLYPKEERFIIIEKVANQLEQNRAERVLYAKKTFRLTCWWIILVLLIVITSGIQIKGFRLLQLSEKIILVLITTTTVNVFGFFLLVMQFLFNKREMAAIEFLFTGKRTFTTGEKPDASQNPSGQPEKTKKNN